MSANDDRSHRPLTRRSLLQLGLAVSAGSVSGHLGAAGAHTARVTPRQTAGPFYPTRDQADKDADLTQVAGREERAKGDVVIVSGQVFGDDGHPIAGGLVDIWQANAFGRYAHEADPNPAPLDDNFQGWAQLRTDHDGAYRFRTIVPGAYPVTPSWSRPPHIHFRVSRRGYHELTTQMYFAGHPLNARDGLLRQHTAAERELLVVAFSADEDGGPRRGRFDIVLRRVQEA